MSEMMLKDLGADFWIRRNPMKSELSLHGGSCQPDKQKIHPIWGGFLGYAFIEKAVFLET